MKNVNGNIEALVQVKSITKNQYGEGIATWTTRQKITGWLDYQNGNADMLNFNAKIQETTHVFICDYLSLPSESESRLLIDNKAYDILYIDNPMFLNYHCEIYLKYVGW